MSLETELRDRLSSAASRADHWPDGLVTADDVIDRRRVARRRHALGGALVAVAVAAAVLVSTVLPGGHQEVPPAAPAAPSITAPLDVWGAPTRGSLAGDADVLAAVMAEKWSYGGPPADRRVVFAGDLGARRWALLAGTVGGQLWGQWFVEDPADPAAGFTEAGSAPLPADGISHAEVLSPQDGALAVVAQPGDQVSVSPGLVVDADGSVRREWTPLVVDDGVASSGLPWPGVAFQFRVERAGRELPSVTTSGVLDYATTADAQAVATQEPRRPSTGTATPAGVQMALGELQSRLGLTVAQLQPALLWTGALSAPDGSTGQAVVVAMTVPSGAVLTSTVWDTPARDPLMPGEAQPCGVGISPAGTALEDLVVVAECAVGQTVVQRQLVVSAPAGSTQVQLETAAGPLDPQQLAGSGVLPDPGLVTGVTVTGPGVGPRRVVVPEEDPFDAATD